MDLMCEGWVAGRWRTANQNSRFCPFFAAKWPSEDWHTVRKGAADMAAPLPGAIPDELGSVARGPRDPRSVRILAKTIYRELRQNGLEEQEVMALAGELLSLLATDVEDRRLGASRCGGQGDSSPPPPAPPSPKDTEPSR